MKKLFNTVIVIICMHIFTYGQNIFDNSKSFNISNYHSSKYTFYNAINSFDYKLSINNTYIFNNKFYTPEIVCLNQYFKPFAKPGYFNNIAKYTNFSRVDFEKSCIPSFPGNNIQISNYLIHKKNSSLADARSFSLKQRLVLNKNEEKLTPFEIIYTSLMIVPSALLMINMHEIGHTFFAKILGDKDAYYVFTKKNEDGGRCIGCNEYDPDKLTNTENAIVQLGGIIFSSQVLPLSSDLLIRNIYMPEFVQRFFAMTYLVSKIDFTYQIYQCFNRKDEWNYVNQPFLPTGPDIYNFTYYAQIHKQKSYNWLLTGMITLNIADIYFSRKQIKRNWQILTGKSYYERK